MQKLAVLSGGPRHAHLPWPSWRWCEYFELHKELLHSIPWERGAELTSAERDLVGPSLQVFQQGEGQDGGHFFRCACEYAESSGDLDYAEAHRLFMNEEMRHGRDLARFLNLARVPLLTVKSWLTRAFCWCGSRGELESTLTVILICELLALSYYKAVLGATQSTVLRRLCAQILQDEKQHVRFHCERLAILRRHRSALGLALRGITERLLLVAATIVCWCGHRRVLHAGGFDFWTFWQQAARQMNPRHDPSL
jgi:hypothetical protein